MCVFVKKMENKISLN